MANILITSEYFCKFDGYAKEMLLKSGHSVIDNPYGHKFLTPDEIIPYISEADAIICDLEKINKEVLTAAKRLKIIARRGVGLDSVDIEECKKRNIEVARCAGLVEAPVAELVMAYILGFSRKIDSLSKDMHCGNWNKVIGNSLFGKTIGLIGFGNIAREVAKRAKAFSMKVIYNDIAPVNSDSYSEYRSLDELLSESDFVSVHVPLLEGTRNMIDKKALSEMKRTAFLINTARGGIVDEEALADALENKLIAGAAIDVFEKEPNNDSLLKKFPNAYITPHVATFTTETFIAMDRKSAQNILDFFNGSRQ